jgi:hypothetical protein
VLAGAAIFWWWWTAAAEAPAQRPATIVAIGSAEHLSSSNPQRPSARLSVRFDDGTSVTLLAEPQMLTRCRVGGRVRLDGMKTNSGEYRWALLPGACD